MAYSVTVRILALCYFKNILSLKYVVDYKAGLKGRIKFVCIAMYSLVMNLCSRDLNVTSLNIIE